MVIVVLKGQLAHDLDYDESVAEMYMCNQKHK